MSEPDLIAVYLPAEKVRKWADPSYAAEHRVLQAACAAALAAGEPAAPPDAQAYIDAETDRQQAETWSFGGAPEDKQ